MGKPYLDDLRVRVVAAMEGGGHCREVGAAFGVAPSTAGNWHRLYRRTQSYSAQPMGGDHRSKLLAHDGILASQLLPCPMTGMIFRQWLEECLIPDMKPGSIVVADNLSAHKVAGIRECLESAGMHLLYLPPYSPDFNALLSLSKGRSSRSSPRSKPCSSK